MAEPVPYPVPKRESTKGGGGGDDGGFLLSLVDIKLAAGEDRMMRELTERATTVQTQLTKQILDVEAKLSAQTATILTRMDQSRAASLPQIIGVIVSAFVAGLAVLAFASDRFDGGLSASAIKDQIAKEQVMRDAAQDAKLDQIIKAVQGLSTDK